MSLITVLKSIVKKLPFNITKNQQYDAQTKKIIQKTLSRNGVFLDVGCHKGEVLDWAIKYAPNSAHIGFEAIPEFALALKQNYPKHQIHNVALADYTGKTTFHHVKTNPAYSGINQREYVKDETIDVIEVDVNTIDKLIPTSQSIDLIKIDVEGGELQVLLGAAETIKRETPVIVFEHGLGASEFYDNGPEKIWKLLHDELGMKISLMKTYLVAPENSFSKEEFQKQYQDKINYYFVAYSI
ncbi:MAG: FkbM family methyltransferase [Parvicellaceae bacterium]